MAKVNSETGDEAPDLAKVSEEGRVAGSGNRSKKPEDDWSSWGMEDPAFFIKPSDRK